MYITTEREDPKEVMMKSMDNPYTWENEKNSIHDRKRTPEVKKAWISWRSKRLWLAVAVVMVTLAGIGTGVALASATHILHQLGFTAKGLASKSFASRLMSSTSQANNHTVPKDSWVSWLQRAGQKGMSTEHQAYFGTGGAIAGAVLTVVLILVLVTACSVTRRCRQQSS